LICTKPLELSNPLNTTLSSLPLSYRWGQTFPALSLLLCSPSARTAGEQQLRRLADGAYAGGRRPAQARGPGPPLLSPPAPPNPQIPAPARKAIGGGGPPWPTPAGQGGASPRLNGGSRSTNTAPQTYSRHQSGPRTAGAQGSAATTVTAPVHDGSRVPAARDHEPARKHLLHHPLPHYLS